MDLEGKRVAVVGTGASAIQFVPAIAGRAAHLTVFERSPGYVVPKKDRAYGATERWLFERVRPLERRLPVVALLEPGEPLALVPEGELGVVDPDPPPRQGDP